MGHSRILSRTPRKASTSSAGIFETIRPVVALYHYRSWERLRASGACIKAAPAPLMASGVAARLSCQNCWGCTVLRPSQVQAILLNAPDHCGSTHVGGRGSVEVRAFQVSHPRVSDSLTHAQTAGRQDHDLGRFRFDDLGAVDRAPTEGRRGRKSSWQTRSAHMCSGHFRC